VKEETTVQEKEILKEETEVRGVLAEIVEEEIEKDLKCMKLFVVIAVRDVRFLLNQLMISLFTVLNALPIMVELQDLIVEKIEEVAVEIDQTDQCLMQLATLVEKDFNYHSDQQEKSQYTVMIALIKKVAVPVL
jgi:hypothetical protein